RSKGIPRTGERSAVLYWAGNAAARPSLWIAIPYDSRTGERSNAVTCRTPTADDRSGNHEFAG
ncbi:MAG: hypothetical protein DWQ45_04600, partial [Planctomycetota bacterium]